MLCNLCRRVADVAHQKVYLVRACAKGLVQDLGHIASGGGDFYTAIANGKCCKKSDVRNTNNAVVRFRFIYEDRKDINLFNKSNPHH